MYRTNSSTDLDSLRTELYKKEEDLVLAARFGKSLLEEKQQLKKELQSAQEECANVNELLQSQKHDSCRSLTEARQTAEAQTQELEQQVDLLRQTLHHERTLAASAKDKYRETIEELQIENARNQRELEVALHKNERESQLQLELKTQLEACELKKQKLSLEMTGLQKQIQSLQDSHKSLTQEVSTLTHTCDRLSDELENKREECEYWEEQCVTRDEEVETQVKELSDSQELVGQLQLQLEQQNMMALTPNSTLSGMTLYEEFSSMNSSTDNLSTDSCEEFPDSPGPEYVEVGPKDVVVSPEKLDRARIPGWEEEIPCCRCQKMEDELRQQKAEIKSIDEQLMMVVQQKFALQQQIEAWQSDMDSVVQKKVHRQLEKDRLPSKKTATMKKTEMKRNPNRSQSWFLH